MSVMPVIPPEIEHEEEIEGATELERLHRVLVHNDDFTPYDFVIVILIRFFKLDANEAERITWAAHSTGIALVAILPLKEAQRRVGQAHFAASLEGFPLTFSIEPV